VTEQRKAIRFNLALPFELIRTGAEPSVSETRNLSSNGVLFDADIDMPVGELIEYVITLPTAPPGSERQVQIRCFGKVVRRHNSRGLAATLDRYEFIRS
jgi:hypothetical protein